MNMNSIARHYIFSPLFSFNQRVYKHFAVRSLVNKRAFFVLNALFLLFVLCNFHYKIIKSLHKNKSDMIEEEDEKEEATVATGGREKKMARKDSKKCTHEQRTVTIAHVHTTAHRCVCVCITYSITFGTCSLANLIANTDRE